MPKALFACYGGGHVKMLSPVILKFLEMDWDVVVLGLTTAHSYLVSLGINSLGFSDFIDPVKDQYALEVGKRLSQEGNFSNISPEESIAYLGISYTELEKQVGKKKAEDSYKKLGRQAFFPFSFMERICQKVCPDVTITTNSPRAEKTLGYVGKKLGIPTVILQDLFFPKNTLLWFDDKNFGHRICVLSQQDKERLISAGRAEEEVVVTGNPSFDCLYKDIGKNSLISKSQSKKKILWISTAEPYHFPAYDIYSDPNLPIKIENVLVDLLKKHPNWNLIIRRHPNEPICERQLTSQLSISASSDSLKDTILFSDLIVTTYSTVALEAHILGKTVLCLEFSPYNELFPFPQYGIAHGISDWNKIEETIQNLLDNPKPLPLAIENIGHATDTVVKVIQQIVHTKPYASTTSHH